MSQQKSKEETAISLTLAFRRCINYNKCAAPAAKQTQGDRIFMALDGFVISNLVYELNQTILNARISKIAQPENDELLFTLKGTGGQFRLAMSASASLPFLYLTEHNKTSPLTAPNFCMLLRKHIANGRIVRIYQPQMERIINFEIEHLDELGDLCKKTLIVELMGKHSNIIFCSSDGMIIDSIKHVSAMMSSVREVLPGRAYSIPATQSDRLNPLEVTEFRLFGKRDDKAILHRKGSLHLLYRHQPGHGE